MKVYILRHGRTDWNAAGRLQGRSDIELNEEGRASARETGEKLKEIPFSAAFSSPLLRARETAELILQGRNLPLQSDARLTELSYGRAEGAYLAQDTRWNDMVQRLFSVPERDYIAPEEGESYADLLVRCRDFINGVLLPHEKEWEHVLLVSHGGTVRGLFSSMLGEASDGLFQKHPPKNCAVNIVDCTDGKFSVDVFCDEYCERL